MAPPSTGPVVQASTEGIEKPTPERSYQLNMANSLSLALSRNEATGTVLKVSTSSCQTVTVSGAPAGVTVDLFHMNTTMKTTNPSFTGAVVGTHYDPLVPLSTTNGQVCAGETFLWADFTVDASVTPGTYSFTVGGLPVSLKVWKLTMPAKPTMPLYFGLDPWALVLGHKMSTSTGTADEAALDQKYIAALRAHRIEPMGQEITDPPVSGSTVDLDYLGTDGGSFRQLDLTGNLAGACSLNPSAIGSSWYTSTQLQAWNNTLSANPALLLNAWAYVTDEPTDIAGTATRAKLVRTYAPLMQTMVTNQPTSALLGLIDHFTVNFEEFKTAGNWTDYSQAPGYWLYGSCPSHGSCSNGTVGNLTGSPDLMLDENDVFDRAFPLVIYAAGGQAGLYYQTVIDYYNTDPWTDQYISGGNGDGTLFYPGIAGTRGFTAQTPVSSIRLKGLRQGQYDIEYLNFAKQAGLATNLSTLVPNQYGWSRKNSDFDAMRASIGNALGN